MVDVLTWTVQQRLELEERAEALRKELAEVEGRLVRLEAAEAVFGEWAEATDGGRRSSGIVDPDPDPDPEPVAVTPGAAGMRLVPERVDGMGMEVLTSDYRRIMEIVADADGPVMAKDVALRWAANSPRRRSSRSGASCANSPTGGGCHGPERAGTCHADLPEQSRRTDSFSVTRGPPPGVGSCVKTNQAAEGSRDAVYQVRLPLS